jgi:hypothetical protein
MMKVYSVNIKNKVKTNGQSTKQGPHAPEGGRSPPPPSATVGGANARFARTVNDKGLFYI